MAGPGIEACSPVEQFVMYMIGNTLKIASVAALLGALALVPTASAQTLPDGPYDDCISRPATEELVCTAFVFIGLTIVTVQETCEDVSPDCNVTRYIKRLT
jgi:hypothetical protein